VKKFRVLLLTLASSFCGLTLGTCGGRFRLSEQEGSLGGSGAISSAHTAMTVQQVQTLSALVTARVDVADVQETRLAGNVGSMRAALLIKGDFLLGTDLARAKFESVDRKRCTAVIVLPQPQVTSPRVDHERTWLFAVTQTGLWPMTPGGDQASAALLNRAYRDAQRFVVESSEASGLHARARQQAEQVLVAFYRATGWQITVRWEQ
jgi:hypothetical protein